MTREQPAGDYDYEAGGQEYAQQRRTDPRIAALVHAALGSARRVVNVGAGAGSYEPTDRDVVAVEPSATMRAQRPAGAAPVVDAVAQSAWGFVDDDAAARAIETLRADLESGAWDERYGSMRQQPFFVGSLRLIVADAAGDRPR